MFWLANWYGGTFTFFFWQEKELSNWKEFLFICIYCCFYCRLLQFVCNVKSLELLPGLEFFAKAGFQEVTF